MAGSMPSVTFIKGQSKNPIVPGVCLIDEQYKYFYNKTLSDGTKDGEVGLYYLCAMKKSSKCTASVILTKDGVRWWTKNLSSPEEHNHICEKSAVLAHKMKKEMYSKVNETPTIDADSVYRNVVTEYEDQYAEADENVWDAAAIKLTEKANIARHVRRIKSTINGPLPKNRNDFDPETIVKNTLGGQKVVVLDSNRHLDSGFGNKLADFNNDEYPQGHGLLSSFIQEDIQNESLSPDDESREEEYLPEGDDSSMEDESEGRRKPKRIILYTTKRLLKLFAH